MKKFSIWIAFLLVATTLTASPVGNTAAPQILEDGFFIPRECWVDVRAGYEGDFVSDGRLKQHQQGHGLVDNYTQNTNSGTVTLNILDRLDIYGVFGSSRTCAEWRFEIAEDVHNAQIETFHDFLWGAGVRAILFQWGNTDLGAGGRYSASRYKPLWLTIDGTNQSVANTHFHWREWQANLDVSYHIDIFTPYGGVKFSNVRTNISNFDVAIASSGAGSNQFENRIPVGMYVGCTLSSGKYFMLNIEGRFIDEEALTVSGDLRF